MDKRAQQKEKTYSKILKISKALYLDHGYIYTSTKDISKKARVSQGTIFLHFKTKEKLMERIILDELQDVIGELDGENITTEGVFQTLVDHELLLSRVSKDYAYLPVKLQEFFNQLKTQYKDLLFDLLKPKSKLSILDLFLLIDMTLALIFEELAFSDKTMLKNKIKKYKKIFTKFA